MDLALVGNTTLRAAIKRNLVSFPSQIPPFMKRGETQERIVQLYFVRGWRMRAIGDRYGLSKSAVRKLLSEWRVRAIAAGYVQEIHPEVLAVLDSIEKAWQQEVFGDPASDPDDWEFSWDVVTPPADLPAAAHH
ncbi:MAG TPA: hypothetical protein VG273_10430 [Bryobacteraceae bacterium]|jgi:hypothetical protein|nr:hypothetical protein [Bryobacteraceae bacterium]